MRKALVAKLGLTALVGLGTLTGLAGIAQAETPPHNSQIGDIKVAPPTTTPPINPIPADFADPEPEDTCNPWVVNCEISLPPQQPEPDPPFDPDLPIALPEDDCHPLQPNCDKVPPPPGDDDPEPECNEILVSCDPELTDDPCNHVTHGCDGGGTTGGDEGTTGGDDGTDGPESTDGPEGTTGGETDGGSGGSLPRTGAEMATWAIAGLGLTGVGAALRKLGKREQEA